MFFARVNMRLRFVALQKGASKFRWQCWCSMCFRGPVAPEEGARELIGIRARVVVALASGFDVTSEIGSKGRVPHASTIRFFHTLQKGWVSQDVR